MGYQILQLLFLLVNLNLNLANQDSVCQNCNQLKVSIDVSGDDIHISWTFNATDLFGFRALIHNEDNDLLYESPLIHLSQRSMTLKQELDEKYTVCIQALSNTTFIIQEDCEERETTDLKMVVGILAGTIFLIPCIIGLSYIIYKDKQIMRGQTYEKLEIESASDQSLAIKIEVKVEKSKTVEEKSEKGVKLHEVKAVPDTEIVSNKIYEEKREDRNEKDIKAKQSELVSDNKTGQVNLGYTNETDEIKLEVHNDGKNLKEAIHEHQKEDDELSTRGIEKQIKGKKHETKTDISVEVESSVKTETTPDELVINSSTLSEEQIVTDSIQKVNSDDDRKPRSKSNISVINVRL